MTSHGVTGVTNDPRRPDAGNAIEENLIMASQTPDDGRETASFKIAYHKIGNVLDRLHDKNVCPCCTSRALTFHAIGMAEHILGSAKAIEMFEDVMVNMRENNIPAPNYSPSSEMQSLAR